MVANLTPLPPVIIDYAAQISQFSHVSLSRCLNGRWTSQLRCIKPDALILIGGRSDTYGVLNSVELVTERGVCRGAVPELPAMRWRTITSTVAQES